MPSSSTPHKREMAGPETGTETKAINVKNINSHVSRLAPSAFEDLAHFSQPEL